MTTDILMIQQGDVPVGLESQLKDAGYRLLLASDSESALATIASRAPALALLDSKSLPNLVAFIQQLRRQRPQCPAIAIVEADQSGLASDAMQRGAMDYLLKPFNGDQLIAAVTHALSLQQPIPNLVVASPASQQVLLLAQKVAQTNASILIGGESGTGKECLARYIHDQSSRAQGPYVAVNCAAIPETMLEATLFGFTRGAFTGAQQDQTGKFELANRGTLLLDEIADMPLGLQAKLLRVLQEREVEKLGSNQKIKLDVRVIAASNKDLRKEAAEGRFREDLYYRLDVLPLCWPALRQRPEDILPLTEHFLEKHAPEGGFELHPDAAQALIGYHWPGNVRELENTIQRALIVSRGLVLQAADLMLPEAPTAAEPVLGDLAAAGRAADYQRVLTTLRRCKGSRRDTAEALGVTTRALRYKLAAMRSHGIDTTKVAVGA